MQGKWDYENGDKFMRTIFQYLILLCYFVSTIVCLVISAKIESFVPDWRSVIAVANGIGFGLLLFMLCSKVNNAFSIAPFKVYSSKENLWGVLYATFVFTLSLIFAAVDTDWHFESFVFNKVFDQILFQIRPAIIEEVGFRYGIAGLIFAFFGLVPALVAGSIPFGILHMLNFLSGDPIYWEYIIGTTVAGLFLTLVFLRHGLVAAILAHYTWNVLASTSAEILRIPQEKIEAGYPTLIILAVVSVWLFWSNQKLKKINIASATSIYKSLRLLGKWS